MNSTGILMALVCVSLEGQNLVPFKIVADQPVTVADALKLRSSTKMTGTGLGYALPPLYQNELSQTVSRYVVVASVDAAGVPSQLVIKYDASTSTDAAAVRTQDLVGRSFEVRVTGAGLDLASKDGKPLSDIDRGYVTTDTQKFINYLSAAAQFSVVKVGTVDFQNVPADLIGNLMGLAKDQVKNASIRQKTGLTIPTFDLKMLVVAAQAEGVGEIPVLGTMTIQQDWSSFEVVLENRSKRTSGSDNDKIRLVVDTDWFLDVSRKIVR